MRHSFIAETERMEAFSDAVIAIIMTIMVLELKVPHEPTLEALSPLLPIFLSYVLSFIFLAIYWNNHHHLIHATRGVSGRIMWANMHLLFWLSLSPFSTAWVGENHTASLPAFAYGVVLLGAACAYTILQRTILAHEDCDSALVRALGSDRKGKISIAFYLIGMCAAFVNPWISYAFFVIVAGMWLIPDRRIARALKESHKHEMRR